MKSFTKEKWKECLMRGEWEKLGQTEDLEDMAKDFTVIVTEALDECAPIKKFKINRNYKSNYK